MKNIKVFILFAGITVLSTGCFSFGTKNKQDYEYVPLKQYKYEQADIKPGDEVRLLAFSGGEKNDKQNVFYYQFIVIRKSTGDTLSILTPLIAVDPEAGVETVTHSTPLQYDPAKGITTAYYEIKDSSTNFILQADAVVNVDDFDTSTDLKPYVDKMVLNQLVVCNKTMPIFNNNYKTAVGILHFKKMPW